MVSLRGCKLLPQTPRALFNGRQGIAAGDLMPLQTPSPTLLNARYVAIRTAEARNMTDVCCRLRAIEPLVCGDY